MTFLPWKSSIPPYQYTGIREGFELLQRLSMTYYKQIPTGYQYYAYAKETKIEEIRDRLNRTVQEDDKPWGITVKAVQINDISLPEELIRAMAAIAEAQREREARILKATGEQEAATKFAEASKIYGENPLAIRLRELQTYTEIGRENNSLVIVAGNKGDELLAGSLSHRLGVIKRRN